MTMFAASYTGCVAGAGIVLSPDTDDWKTAPYCCIEIMDGAELSCQNAYMTEVLAAACAVTTQFTGRAPKIWTDWMALKTADAVSWATITGHNEHSLCFEALQRALPWPGRGVTRREETQSRMTGQGMSGEITKQIGWPVLALWKKSRTFFKK